MSVKRTQSKVKVHPQIASLIEELHGLLLTETEPNQDFAYIILIRGKVVAASTMTNGYVAPTRNL